MKAEDYDNMIAVLLHAKAGGKVEFKRKDRAVWEPSGPPANLAWEFLNYDYRIAVEPPKPKECWVSFEKNGKTISAATEDDIKRIAYMNEPSNGYCLMRQVGEYVRVNDG